MRAIAAWSSAAAGSRSSRAAFLHTAVAVSTLGSSAPPVRPRHSSNADSTSINSGETFTGAVEQVRLNPVVEQNVVTYAAIISAPNPELKLKPGMTASVTGEIARRDDVLRVSNAALRFRPDEDALAALEAAPPAASPKGADAATVWRSTADAVVAVAIRTGIADFGDQ